MHILHIPYSNPNTVKELNLHQNALQQNEKLSLEQNPSIQVKEGLIINQHLKNRYLPQASDQIQLIRPNPKYNQAQDNNGNCNQAQINMNYHLSSDFNSFNVLAQKFKIIQENQFQQNNQSQSFLSKLQQQQNFSQLQSCENKLEQMPIDVPLQTFDKTNNIKANNLIKKTEQIIKNHQNIFDKFLDKNQDKLSGNTSTQICENDSLQQQDQESDPKHKRKFKQKAKEKVDMTIKKALTIGVEKLKNEYKSKINIDISQNSQEKKLKLEEKERKRRGKKRQRDDIYLSQAIQRINSLRNLKNSKIKNLNSFEKQKIRNQISAQSTRIKKKQEIIFLNHTVKEKDEKYKELINILCENLNASEFQGIVQALKYEKWPIDFPQIDNFTQNQSDLSHQKYFQNCNEIQNTIRQIENEEQHQIDKQIKRIVKAFVTKQEEYDQFKQNDIKKNQQIN